MESVPLNTAGLAESNGLGALRRQYATATGVGMGCFIALSIACTGLIVVLIATHSSPLELLLLFAVLAVVLFSQYQSSTSYERVDVYERGFIVSLKGKGPEVVRWQEVGSVRVLDVYRGGRQVFVSLHSGRQLVLHGTISGFDELCALLRDSSADSVNS